MEGAPASSDQEKLWRGIDWRAEYGGDELGT